MNSTHHVHRGPESLPCYCTANSDHLIGEEAMSPGEKLARLFHETYERLAPSFGYETRTETRQFDPTTPNGRLMIAVCTDISDRHGAGDADRSAELTTAWMAGAERERERAARDAEEGSLRFIAKRNLHRLIEIGSTDKETMLKCLEELS